MLYTAWRNETTDLLKDSQTYQEWFEVVKNEKNRKQYENHAEILDQAVQDIEGEQSGSMFAPDTQDREIGSKVSELFGCLCPRKDKQHAEYNSINDIGIYPRTNDADLRKLVQSFNVEQKELFIMY